MIGSGASRWPVSALRRRSCSGDQVIRPVYYLKTASPRPRPQGSFQGRLYANNFGDLDGILVPQRRVLHVEPAQPHVRPVRGTSLPACRAPIGIDEGRQCLEIGGTYYRPQFRGTGFNRRVKDMMLQARLRRGVRRVEFRVDRRNARSQAAMKKLGAVREASSEHDRITWTGHVRDTVLFAILKDEWFA